MGNTIVWFDVPVINLDRAVDFYSALLGAPLQKVDMGGFMMGMFPEKDGVPSGCLFVSTEVTPSANGILIYFDVQGRLADAAKAAALNGGTIIEDVHAIGPYGFRALILDSEGNRIALHSQNND